MKTTDIHVGTTYVNRGAGKTRRTVLEISDKCRPVQWLGAPECKPTNEPGVRYVQHGVEGCLYLSSFASWAGKAA